MVKETKAIVERNWINLYDGTDILNKPLSEMSVRERENYKNKYDDRIKERVKKYQQNNKEKISTSHKKYYQNNKEKILAYNKKYYQNNKKLNDLHKELKVKKQNDI